jgi:uracil-DNA glycosylase
VLHAVAALDPHWLATAPRARREFAHGAAYSLDGWLGKPRLQLLDCYHVSQQNTFTGRLTPAMLDEVIRQAQAT